MDRVRISVGVSTAQLQELEQFGKREMRIGLQRALADTQRHVRAVVARQIGASINLPIGTIKQAISAKKPNFETLMASVGVNRPRGIPLISYAPAALRQFDAKTPKRGVSVKTRKVASGQYPAGSQKLPGAFLAIAPGNTRQRIMVRTGEPKRLMKRGKRQGQMAEPIKQLYGPTPVGAAAFAQAEGGGQISQAVLADAAEFLSRQVDSQIQAGLAGKLFTKRK